MTVRLALLFVVAGLTAILGGPGSRAEGPPDPRYALKPADTSSPRATLRTFLEDSEAGWRSFWETGQRRAGVSHAFQCLDLREVSPALRADLGFEAGLQLFDALNRIPLPPLDQVPDAATMDREGRTHWTVPDTSIRIARVEEGPRAGEWLFTPQVIEDARSLYLATRSLPLKPGAVVEDGYRIGITLPGPMIPSSWFLAFPDWSRQVYFDQTVWQWLASGLVVAIACLLAWLGLRIGRSAPGQPGSPRPLVAPLTLVLLSSAVLEVLDEQLNITGDVLTALRHLLDAVFYLAAGWATVLAARIVAEAIIASRGRSLDALQAQLLRVASRVASYAVLFVIVLFWTQAVGISLLGALAGLGVGGIAVALAAQRTLENFLGGFNLLADHPVRVGDFCRFGTEMGTVERIGLRSTRIRTPDRSVLTIPNAEFSRMQLENLALRDRIRFRSMLNLRLETTPEQVELLLGRLRALLAEHPDLADEPRRARLVAAGPTSIDVEVLAYVETRAMDEFLRVREELLLAMLREVEAAGTTLAPLSQMAFGQLGGGATGG